MDLQAARHVLDALRPNEPEQGDESLAYNVVQPRHVLDADDVGEIKARAWNGGYNAGYTDGVRESYNRDRSARARAIQEAETLGALAGLQCARDIAARHLSTLVDREAPGGSTYAIGGPVDAALDVPIDMIAEMFEAISREGLHGERLPTRTTSRRCSR
jgi:hypothetical protein